MATMPRRPDRDAVCAAFLAVVKDTGGSMLISMCKQRTFFPNDGVPRDARKAARDVVVKLIEHTLPYDWNHTVSECTKACIWSARIFSFVSGRIQQLTLP